MRLSNYVSMVYMTLGRPLRKTKEEWKPWVSEAFKILKPPEKLTVSQWADKNRVLDSKISARPGQWETNNTPYLREIMDAFNNPEVEEITFVASAQVGKTESLNNIIGFIVCQDQGPTLYLYPTLELAEYASKNRLQPMISQSPAVREHFLEDSSKLLELQFDGMYLVLSGANSPASLASRPIQYLIIDERDKFPTNAGREANPESLARERTKTFAHNRKIVKACSPTFKYAPTWKSWETADCQKRYYVPCPHCGHYQTFKFKGGIKWSPEAKTPEDVRKTAYYECNSCKGVITDYHKPQMVRAGEWRAEKEHGKKHTAYHINAIYSLLDVTFGDVAAEFYKSKGDPDLLMNFVNSWLAEPWEQTEARMNSDIVMERQTNVPEGIVPNGTMLLTGGVDVQRDGFYFTIRAWGMSMTSQNIAHGFVNTWNDVEFIMNQMYTGENGEEFQINLCAIDSGDQTDDVYEFCAINSDWAIPVKGSNTPLMAPYRVGTIDRVGNKANGMRLYIVDGGQYKDKIAARLNRPNGKGSWMVFRDCDREYAEQICSEEKVIEKVAGREVAKWKPKTSHADNHYLDAEVYCWVAADLLHVRYLQPEQGQQGQQPQEQQKPAPKPQQDDFIRGGDDWIKGGEDWIR